MYKRNVENDSVSYSFIVLSEFEDGGLTGPMSPMLAAKEIASALNTTLLGVIRVNFESEDIYQCWDSEPPNRTYNDHLILIFKGWFIFCVDYGLGVKNLAAYFGENEIDVKDHPDGWIEKMSNDGLKKLMTTASGSVNEYTQSLRESIREYKSKKVTC